MQVKIGDVWRLESGEVCQVERGLDVYFYEVHVTGPETAEWVHRVVPRAISPTRDTLVSRVDPGYPDDHVPNDGHYIAVLEATQRQWTARALAAEEQRDIIAKHLHSVLDAIRNVPLCAEERAAADDAHAALDDIERPIRSTGDGQDRDDATSNEQIANDEDYMWCCEPVISGTDLLFRMSLRRLPTADKAQDRRHREAAARARAEDEAPDMLNEHHRDTPVDGGSRPICGTWDDEYHWTPCGRCAWCAPTTATRRSVVARLLYRVADAVHTVDQRFVDAARAVQDATEAWLRRAGGRVLGCGCLDRDAEFCAACNGGERCECACHETVE